MQQQVNKKDITKTNIFKKNVKKIDLNPIGLNAICFVEDAFKITEHSTRLIFDTYKGKANYNNQDYEFVVAVDNINKNKIAIIFYDNVNLYFIALCRSTLKLQNKRKIYYIYNTQFNINKKDKLIHNFIKKINDLKNNMRIYFYVPINLDDLITLEFYDIQELITLHFNNEIILHIERYNSDIATKIATEFNNENIKIYRSSVALIL